MIDRKKYREYKLEQTRIQGNINTEFDYFINTDTDVEVIEDEFISNVKISGDYHDMMLKEDIEIAFQSAENELVIIPNYETLEVMLVERGLTYDAIRVQTNIDDFIYNNLYLLDDRSEEYSNVIRFESGYKPAFPFVRDPGDYIDGDDYDEQVYQKQTYLEKLRARFEGNMIILNTNGELEVESLRMMIYGEWRPVAYASTGNGRAFPEITTLEYYNHIYGLELEYDATADWNDNDSVLNDFNHYDYDEGGRRGIDNTDYVQVGRYQRYHDVTNNEVFNLEYMQPFEPEGSELYYNEYRPWQEIS